ncbi:hypothetical protein VE25_17170 [Devosia geojensis]|uniref:PRC-barrel domain-containing protein n=1 Tax=Devosia geojensis TaxID=443610 RepID=A0A0F5FPX0_9HYPH|nr:hypothetical protein [Devosia geojensis]KKB10605.1 hypothetical protein VE25_17170 [Devosia geojensis]
MHALPETLHVGMKVFDSTNAEIGTVEDFKFSDEDPATPGLEQNDVHPMDRERDDDLVSIMARAFAGEDGLSDELKEKLLREGFVRIDAEGLFAGDRYITPDQIARADGDRLVLSVPKSDLMHVH